MRLPPPFYHKHNPTVVSPKLHIIPWAPKSSVCSPRGRRGPIAYSAKLPKTLKPQRRCQSKCRVTKTPIIKARQNIFPNLLNLQIHDVRAQSSDKQRFPNQTLDTIGDQLIRLAQPTSLSIEPDNPNKDGVHTPNDHAPAGGTSSGACSPSPTTRGRRVIAHDKPPC